MVKVILCKECVHAIVSAFTPVGFFLPVPSVTGLGIKISLKIFLSSHTHKKAQLQIQFLSGFKIFLVIFLCVCDLQVLGELLCSSLLCTGRRRDEDGA